MNQKVLSAGLLFLMSQNIYGCFPDIFSCASNQEKDEGTWGAQAFITPKSSSLFPSVMRRGDHSFDQTYEVIDLGQDLRTQVASLIQQKVTFVMQDSTMRNWPQKNLRGYNLAEPSREHMRQWADFVFHNRRAQILDLPNGNLKQSFTVMPREEQIELIQRALFSMISGDDL